MKGKESCKAGGNIGGSQKRNLFVSLEPQKVKCVSFEPQKVKCVSLEPQKAKCVKHEALLVKFVSLVVFFLLREIGYALHFGDLVKLGLCHREKLGLGPPIFPPAFVPL